MLLLRVDHFDDYIFEHQKRTIRRTSAVTSTQQLAIKHIDLFNIGDPLLVLLNKCFGVNWHCRC